MPGASPSDMAPAEFPSIGGVSSGSSVSMVADEGDEFFHEETVPSVTETVVLSKPFETSRVVPRTEAVATGERTVKPTRLSAVFLTFDFREPVSRKSFVLSLFSVEESCSTVTLDIGAT